MILLLLRSFFCFLFRDSLLNRYLCNDIIILICCAFHSVLPEKCFYSVFSVVVIIYIWPVRSPLLEVYRV
jgi:hypothetical protein